MNAQTLQSFKRCCLTKIFLLVLVWIVLLPPRNVHYPVILPKSYPPPASRLFDNPTKHTKLPNRNAEMQGQLTPSYRVESSTVVKKVSQTSFGSTSHGPQKIISIISTTLSSQSLLKPVETLITTIKSTAPIISHPKPKKVEIQEQKQNLENCKVDERGRCLDGIHKKNTELADAVAECGIVLVAFLQSIEISISPFFLFLLFSFTCALLEAMMSRIEERIIMNQMLLNPIKSFEMGDSFEKLFSRSRFFLQETFTRYYREILLLSLAAGAATAVLVECWISDSLELPIGRWSSLFLVTDYSKLSLFRALISLEAGNILISLIQPLKHLLPPSILPSEVDVPSFLLVPTSRTLTSKPSISTSWLITYLFEYITTSISMIQLVVPLFYLSGYAVYSFPPLMVFILIRIRVSRLTQLTRTAKRAVACISTLFESFPGDVQLDPDWLCTICFEGDIDEGSVKSKRVTLHCGHRYHAPCLIAWLHTQNFCPVCHHSIEFKTEVSFAPTPSLRNNQDVFPGNRGHWNIPHH